MKNKTIILYVKLFMILSLFIGFQKCTPQEKNSDIQPIVVGMLGKVNAIPYYKEHVESEGADWYY
ncbi:MAG: hypothetical protein OEZ36_09190, partial [Spirochaetota bacterium]|nr:hypothetical protein [Spirochaetota bacterium]